MRLDVIVNGLFTMPVKERFGSVAKLTAGGFRTDVVLAFVDRRGYLEILTF